MKRVKLVEMGSVVSPISAFCFLFNMFRDRHILPVAEPLRSLASLFITLKRIKTTISIYRTVGPSPSGATVKSIAKKLADKGLNADNISVYTKPYLKDGAEFSVALYPFYSHTTHGAIVERSKRVLAPFCVYPEFQDMVVSAIKEAMNGIPEGVPKVVLLSAHSLPEALAKKTADPYRSDVERFSLLIGKLLKMPVFVSFQSRLGRLKWFEPTTEEMIGRLSDKFEALVLVPVSFVVDNTETVYEMDVVYRELAFKKGFKYFKRVRCLNDDDAFVDFLFRAVREKV